MDLRAEAGVETSDGDPATGAPDTGGGATLDAQQELQQAEQDLETDNLPVPTGTHSLYSYMGKPVVQDLSVDEQKGFFERVVRLAQPRARVTPRWAGKDGAGYGMESMARKKLRELQKQDEAAENG